VSLAVLQDRVAEMASRSRDFAKVEGMIEAAQLGEEEKSALWLLAWSYREPDARTRPRTPAVGDAEPSG
jgi:hypothetical protein